MGLFENKHCKAGIEMETMIVQGDKPYRSILPCCNPEVSHHCPKHEPYTEEEERADDLKIADFLKKMAALSTRKSEECPHCGAHVEEMEQIGRCVYSRPCGCRQFQGQVPTAWKGAQS